jgi:DNA mismatch repair ATPase MutL
MKTRFLISTAVGLAFATAASAQSPNATTTSPTTQQTQTPTTSSTATQKSPDTTAQTPSASTPTASTTTSPSAASPQVQTTAPASSGGTSASQPTQAQTSPQSPSTAQAPANNQAQQAPAGGTANTAAQQPAQPSTATNNAQPSSANVNASVNINDQQRTRVAQSITRLNVQPLNNVNFSLSVGTAVPRDVHLQTLPSDVVEIVPQYRGYSFFVVRDEIVIVEPSTYQIVSVLPRNGGSTAAAPAPAPSRSKVAFTDKDRDVVRRHVKTRTTERQTTGSTAKVAIRRGERLPDTVEVEEFPETVYREAPSLREYRYIHRENRTYLVDPGERRVIEEID